MQLAEQGKLDLKVEVNRYLEAYKIAATYPEPITLTHLLTHAAGFEDHALRIPTGLSFIWRISYLIRSHIRSAVAPAGIVTWYWTPSRTGLASS